MGTTTSAAQLHQENHRVIQKLRRSNDELNHLVRALSHDMRVNFLLLASSFSHLKQNLAEPLTDELAQGVEHVEACLRQSQQFLEDLVELGRTGNVQVEPSAVDAAKVVDEVLFEQRETLAERGVDVVVRRPLPTFWCNEGRLKQILVNLLRNAVKHGCDPQCPKITIETASPVAPNEPAASLSGLTALRIHDNGPGIDPAFHEEIFLPGRRLPGASSEGTGMGLAIVQKIVDHYCGSVYVDGQCPSGTAFVVSLPAAPDAAACSPDAAMQTPGAVPPALVPSRHRPHRGPHKNPPHHSPGRSTD